MRAVLAASSTSWPDAFMIVGMIFGFAAIAWAVTR